jgi:outer membrane protein
VKLETKNPLMKFLMLIMLIGSLFTWNVKAQEKWSLNRCIEYGIKNNLQLRNNELNARLATESYQQSKWNLFPSVGAGSDIGRNFGKSIDPNTNGMVNTSFFNNSYYLSASMDLFHGFMLQNQIRYSKFKKEAAKNNQTNAVDELAFEIMNAFFNVIYYEEMLKIAEEQKNLSKLNLKKTEMMVSSGFKAQTELLDVKANFEKDELACIRTANQIESARISLKKAMNLPSDHELSLLEPDQKLPEDRAFFPSIDELFSQHSIWSPKIRSFENEWRAQKKEVLKREASFLPAFRFSASFSTGYYETNKDAQHDIISFNEQMRNNQREFVGASVSIPVFDKNYARFSVRQSKMQAKQLENRLQQAKQELFYEIEQNYNDLTAYSKELQQAEKQQEADQLSFQAAQKKFDQGMINVVEFYVIKNQYASSVSQVLHSKLMLEIKQRMMDFYKGNRFWELDKN